MPAVAILLLANAPGGIDGQVSKAWKQATDPAAPVPDNSPERLTATSSVRARYWEEAVEGARPDELLGAGAGAYGTAAPALPRQPRRRPPRPRLRRRRRSPTSAGSGSCLSLLAAGAWLAPRSACVGVPRRRDRGLPWDAERVGLATLAVVVIVFGVHSAIDWTWYVPGNAVPRCMCAGCVASRATLRERLAGRRRSRARRRDPAACAAAAAALVIARSR